MTRPARQGEGALSDAIREALRWEPGLLLDRNSQAGRTYRGGLGVGSADLVGVLRVLVRPTTMLDGAEPVAFGRFVALEVKLPGKIPTPERIAKLLAAQQALLAAQQARRVGARAEAQRAEMLAAADARDLAQWEWLAERRNLGGFACYVDSVEGARVAIARARRGESQ